VRVGDRFLNIALFVKAVFVIANHLVVIIAEISDQGYRFFLLTEQFVAHNLGRHDGLV